MIGAFPLDFNEYEMKIIAMVNGGFGIPTLRALKESKHEIVAVFAMPLRAKEKGRGAGAPPIRRAMEEFLAGTPFYDPENVNLPENVEAIRALNADLIFICDYGKILSKALLGATKFGGLNLHGSLLPKYRGAAPINRAIQNGEKELGVSVIFIEPTVDSGPIVGVDSYFPTIEETAVEIEERLSQIGAPLTIKAIDQIEQGAVQTLTQNDAEVSLAPKLKKEEGRIDWSKSSDAIIDQYRAFQPWPRTFADRFKRDEKEGVGVRLILGSFSKVDASGVAPNFENADARPGAIVSVSKDAFWIKTGDGFLRPLSVQPAGKKNMPTEIFLRGSRLEVGDELR